MNAAIKGAWTVAKPFVVKGLKFLGEAAAAAALEKGSEKLKAHQASRKKSASQKTSTQDNKSASS
jgi:hypothetical protein